MLTCFEEFMALAIHLAIGAATATKFRYCRFHGEEVKNFPLTYFAYFQTIIHKYFGQFVHSDGSRGDGCGRRNIIQLEVIISKFRRHKMKPQ